MPVVPTRFLAPQTAAQEQPAPHTADRGETAMRRLRDPFAVTAEPTRTGPREPQTA
ncbi:hypothetical protein [Paractinoplanes lichenicola]|uniref:Uncharacterized protein n=1 Tax=Paractinoplanes lichenicola TaxID=2802976 RepID=A0ABS1VUE3_9ACTN|nr:hypothetical protein [Actinoplanes lichenicola]MBL7258075.1 hypothetical protein [Actinoplanes lichenicola]